MKMKFYRIWQITIDDIGAEVLEEGFSNYNDALIRIRELEYAGSSNLIIEEYGVDGITSEKNNKKQEYHFVFGNIKLF
jgi:hypothetical protein